MQEYLVTWFCLIPTIQSPRFSFDGICIEHVPSVHAGEVAMLIHQAPFESLETHPVFLSYSCFLGIAILAGVATFSVAVDP